MKCEPFRAFHNYFKILIVGTLSTRKDRTSIIFELQNIAIKIFYFAWFIFNLHVFKIF
jgi:hypothetical protein